MKVDSLNLFSNISLLNKEKINNIFEYLNDRLKENQLQLEITIYGGTVMTLVYDNRPATRDIDCVFSEVNTKILEVILDDTKFTFNLSDNWINEEIKEPLKYIIKEEKEIFKQYSNLQILKPNAKQLLAMKVLAARPEPAKDFIDCYILCKDLGIESRQQLISVIEKYIPLSLIGERQKNFIIYLGEDLGYDWK